MNLDIMSLMAASAAVSDTQSETGKGKAALPGLASGNAEDIPFAELLQSLTTSLENTEEVLPEALTATSGRSDGTALSVLQSTIEDAPGETDALLTSLSSGSRLPDDGNALPPATALQVTNPAAATILSETAASAAQQTGDPSATLPPLNATTLAAADTRQVSTAQTGTASQAAGWFSQRSLAPATPAAAASDSPGMRAEASAGLDPRSAAETPLLRSGAADDGESIPRPAAELKATALAERLQSLASQTAGPGQGAILAEISSPDAPRAAPTNPVAGLSASTSPASTTVPAPLAAPINLNQAGWDKALGQRLVFMAASGIESAELRLDPPQLGTVHVKLSMQGDQAQVVLQAANPLARDAMETALPRLRDMLGSEGVQLDSAQVADRDSGQRQREADPQSRDRTAFADEDLSDASESDSPVTRVETLTAGSGVISERV